MGRKDELTFNLILLVVGIILTVWPDESLNVAINVIGGVIVAFGITNICIWLMNKGINYASLFIGILTIVIGIFVILKSEVLISIIHILLGIAVLANGITNFKVLYDVKTDSRSWKVLISSSVITIALGLLLIFKPLMIADFIIRFGGIVFILSALEGLLIYYQTGKIK